MKEQAREIAREIITRELEPLIEAQIANALGISYFLLRNKTTGKFEPISDPDKIEAAINAGEEYYRIYTKDPNVHAFAVEVLRPGEPKSYIRPWAVR